MIWQGLAGWEEGEKLETTKSGRSSQRPSKPQRAPSHPPSLWKRSSHPPSLRWVPALHTLQGPHLVSVSTPSHCAYTTGAVSPDSAPALRVRHS